MSSNEDEFFIVTFDKGSHRFLLWRTARPFETVEEVHLAFRKVHLEIDRSGDPGQSILLIDLRNGPARNDPVFESAVASERNQLLLRFRKVAFIVATRVGRLQLVRHLRESGLDAVVAHTEAEAIRLAELD